MNKKGFTIVELLVVIVILGILSAVAIPQIMNSYDTSKEHIVDIYNKKQNCEVYCNDEKIFEGDFKDFDMSSYEMLTLDYIQGKLIVKVKIK